MATQVPRYQQPQVQEHALSNAKFEGKLPDDNTGKVLETAGAAAESIGKAAQAMKYHADKYPVLESATAFQDFANMEQVGEDGYMKVKGKDALQIEEKYGERMTKRRNEIMGSLANDDQRAMFKQHADKIEMNQRYKMIAYSGDEMQKYSVSLNKADIQVQTNTAVLNHGDKYAFNEAMLRKDERIDDLHRLGVIESPEEAQLMKYKTTSAVHRSVVDRIFQDQGAFSANRYLQEHKKAFSEDDLSAATAHIDAQLTEEKGNYIAEKVFAQEGYEGKSAAYARIKELTKGDTKLFDAAMSKYGIKASLKQQDQNNKVDLLAIDASKFVDSGGDYHKAMTSEQFAQLSPKLRKALDDRMLVVAGVKPEKSDAAIFHEYDNKPSALLGRVPYEDLLVNVQPNVTGKQWNKIRDQWELSRAALKGDEKAKDQVAGLQGWKDVLFREMKTNKVAGLNDDSLNESSKLTSTQTKAFEVLQEDMDDMYRVWTKANPGKKPDADEMHAIAKSAVKNRMPSLWVKNSWYSSDVSKTKADIPNMTKEEQARSYVPFEDISEKDASLMLHFMRLNDQLEGHTPDDTLSLIKADTDFGRRMKKRMQEAAAHKIIGNGEAVKNKLLGK